MCWGSLLTDGWDRKIACLILDLDLSDSVWLLCCTGLTLKLFPSLLITPPLGSLLGCSWLPPVTLWGCLCLNAPFDALRQAVLGQTSVPWERAGLCPGIVIPNALQCTSWTALSCTALGMLRITQVSSYLAVARIHSALGTLTPAGAQSPPPLPF